MPEEEKDDWLDDLDGEDDDAAEIDQSDIDSLLSGDADGGDAEQEASSEAEGENPAKQEASSEDDANKEEGELDSSDIDALLSDTNNQADDSDPDPDQNEIDELFSEVDGDVQEEPFEAEEVDFKDVIEDDEGDESAFDESSFDAEEFGLDDDIPDLPHTSGEGADETTMFDDADTDFAAPNDATQIMEGAPGSEAGGGKKFQMPAIAIPEALKNRKTQAIIGGSLVLLVAAGFFFMGGSDEAPIDVAKAPAVKEDVPPKPTPRPQNTAPQVADTDLQLAGNSNELAVILSGIDAENDALDYEILSLPEHGRLSGKAPILTYIPNKNFPGQDSLIYRVTDGQDFSDPATISISAAPPEKTVAKEDEKPKAIKEKMLTIAAKGRSYNLDSTDSLVINWRKLWQGANYLPFSSKVAVEIVSKKIHGSLKKVSNRKHSYRPDKYFGGTESIKYRFRLGKLKSEVKTLRFNIALRSPAPEIHIGKIARQYSPGDTVVIDASGTRDENRDSVKFSWQQISGVPVQLEIINQEGSRIAFVVPSSFNTIANPGPVLRLTAVDKKGKQDVKDIKVTTKSRRQTAMWRGLVSGGIAEDPNCPYGNCSGALLPFPYGD